VTKSTRVLRLLVTRDSGSCVELENGLLSIYDRPSVRRSLPALSPRPCELAPRRTAPARQRAVALAPRLTYQLDSSDCSPFKQLFLEGHTSLSPTPAAWLSSHRRNCPRVLRPPRATPIASILPNPLLGKSCVLQCVRSITLRWGKSPFDDTRPLTCVFEEAIAHLFSLTSSDQGKSRNLRLWQSICL